MASKLISISILKTATKLKKNTYIFWENNITEKHFLN